MTRLPRASVPSIADFARELVDRSVQTQGLRVRVDDAAVIRSVAVIVARRPRSEVEARTPPDADGRIRRAGGVVTVESADRMDLDGAHRHLDPAVGR